MQGWKKAAKLWEDAALAHERASRSWEIIATRVMETNHTLNVTIQEQRETIRVLLAEKKANAQHIE